MMEFDMDFYKGKRVLLTGHTGFKGSWMSRILVSAGAELTGYSTCTKKELSLFKLSGVENRLNHVAGDVRDLEHLKEVFEQTQPEVVIHMAAQPIVRDSYRDPVHTYDTNVMGTVNILECVRRHTCVKSFLNVTTDKVYLNREWCWGYREDEPLDGYDPYSNSKSCSELVTHSYYSSFLKDRDMAVSTVRAGNVIGGGDFAHDRIIPDCVRAAMSGSTVLVRNPHSIRPYQHVLEPVMAYLMIVARQYADHQLAGWYNVGPDEVDCVSTGELAGMFCEAWGNGLSWEDHSEPDAPHEANFLKLDSTKIRTVYGWKPRWHMDEAVQKAVEWTRVWSRGGDVPEEMDREIKEYMKD